MRREVKGEIVSLIQREDEEVRTYIEGTRGELEVKQLKGEIYLYEYNNEEIRVSGVGKLGLVVSFIGNNKRGESLDGELQLVGEDYIMRYTDIADELDKKMIGADSGEVVLKYVDSKVLGCK